MLSPNRKRICRWYQLEGSSLWSKPFKKNRKMNTPEITTDLPFRSIAAPTLLGRNGCCRRDLQSRLQVGWRLANHAGPGPHHWNLTARPVSSEADSGSVLVKNVRLTLSSHLQSRAAFELNTSIRVQNRGTPCFRLKGKQGTHMPSSANGLIFSFDDLRFRLCRKT